MDYSKEILERVKNAGILQYNTEQVVTLINPEDEQQFRNDIANPNSVLCFIYTEGLNHGKYNLDVALFKLQSAEADKALLEVKRQREVDNAVAEYLGETTKEE